MILLFLHKGALEVVGTEEIWSHYHFVRVVTDTSVSGHFANFNMQLYFCDLHALVSTLMYVALKMIMYLMCKMHFW